MLIMDPSWTIDYPFFIGYIEKLKIPVFQLDKHILYKGEDLVGEGSISTVYRGTLKKNPSKDESMVVGLKISKIAITENSRSRRVQYTLSSILQETRVLHHLSGHPNILKLYGIAFQELKPILVIELAVCCITDHLESKKNANNRVDWATKARYCCEVADSLQALHSVGVVHGDPKGPSIFMFPAPELGDALTAKIGNLAFSTTIDELSSGGVRAFTPHFQAPECTTDAPPNMIPFAQQPTIDNYVFGLFVAQVAMDGDFPFERLRLSELMKIKHTDPELQTLLNSLPPDTPDEFKSVITAASKYWPPDRIDFSEVREIMMKNPELEQGIASDPYAAAKRMFESHSKQITDKGEKVEFLRMRNMAVPASVKKRMFEDYMKDAERGNVWAQFYIARCYQTGFGVDPDEKEAAKWYIEFSVNSADIPGQVGQKFDVKIFDINQCDIENEIGAGNSMTVYKGFCEIDEVRRPVALKFPKMTNKVVKEQAIKDAFMDIRQEVRLMLQLNSHPNIVQFFGIVFKDVTPGVIVELAEKGDLSSYLFIEKENGEAVDWPVKARFCEEIASAIDWGHNKQLVFGDLKCENVLVISDPRDDDEERVTAKLSDFGYSRTITSVQGGRLPGFTPAFQAPEYTEEGLKQWRGNIAGDIFSFGCVVHQVVNDGEAPLSRYELGELLNIKQSAQAFQEALLSEISFEAPREFTTVITMATIWKPDERTPLNELGKILHELYQN